MASIQELIAARKAEIAAEDALKARRKSDLRKFLSGMLVGDAVGLLISAYAGKQAYLAMWNEQRYMGNQYAGPYWD